jgi:malonate-semialdehyde dehydrogenase (acetylating)/methylmalonate-semialdehyde dehydrogenase
MRTIGHWIAGAETVPSGSRLSDVHDPATGAVSARVACASTALVDEVLVDVRERWQRTWRSSTLTQRSRVLFAFRELVASHLSELADLIVAEHGKVHADALGEVQRGLEVVEFACGIPHLQKGSYSESVSTAVDSYSLRQPLGVVAGITPFNFPAMVPMWMFPIAIATGNAFVLKPSERDPSVSLRLAELWSRAGLPDGIFTVLNGDREAVDALLEHPAIDGVSFVGSTPVARHVFETATRAGKRVQALGGAKNHMVVMPDADLELAADAAVSAAYGSAGERCMAISVLVAVGDIAEPLVAAIGERMQALRVGPGDDPTSEMGPLITAQHRDRVASYVEAGRAAGADVVVDGTGFRYPGREDGFWLGPCLLDHVHPDMTVYREEIFGPVLSVVRAASFSEALELINANPYGNGTAIFTSDGALARRFQSEVEVGMIGINVPIPVPMAYYSFGGWKSSLFGDSHMHGTEGVQFYTRGKVVTARWKDTSGEGVNLLFPTS